MVPPASSLVFGIGVLLLWYMAKHGLASHHSVFGQKREDEGIESGGHVSYRNVTCVASWRACSWFQQVAPM